MNVGEVLRRSQTTTVNVVRGLRAAHEAKRYGNIERRQAAYAELRGRFVQLFKNNSQKVGTLKSDPTIRRLLFDWQDIGQGSLDEKDGNYAFHVTSYPFDRKDGIFGEKKKFKHSEIQLTQESATVTEWVETSVTPPTDPSFPMVTSSRVKQSPLDVQTAMDLVEGLGTELFKPTMDSWFADYSKTNEE